MNLSKQKCSSSGKQESLQEQTQIDLKAQLSEGWEVINGHHLEKTFPFKEFSKRLAFTNLVANLGEEEGHHPDIHLSWQRVRIAIWTSAVNGLTKADFILAAKIDKISL